ncbi:MAG: site-2 protease family protein [Sumerlaeia bacterium]
MANLRWFITKTIHVSTVFGIPIHVHLLLLLFLPLFALDFINVSMGFGTLLTSLLFAVTFIGILYISVLLHELGHAWGNHLVGGQTHQIILLPIGGVAIGSGSDRSPKTEFLVVALGPAVSVLLALVGYLSYYIVKISLDLSGFTPQNSFVTGVIFYITVFTFTVGSLNTALALFNLLVPIFPMDSARLLRSGFSMKYNPQIVTRWVTKLGIGLAIFIIFLWLTGIRLPIPYIGQGTLWLSIIAFLGIQACLMEQQRLAYGDTYSAQDNWGGRTVYYDSDAMSLAHRRAEAELGSLGFLVSMFSRRKGSSVKGKKPISTIRRSERVENISQAKIIDLSDDIDPASVSDVELLKKMMKQAANNEDFPRAGEIQNRINQLLKKSE